MLRVLAIGLLLSISVLGLACAENDSGANGDNTSERDEFIQGAEDRIADLRAELEELRQDIADGDAGAEVEEQADALERRIGEAETKLDEVRAASSDEWKDLKGSIDEALGDAGDLVDQIGSELGID